MTLRTPILDDRSYAQLRDELVARIPVYAPEWTDHQPSDPGITLIELFAFLGENLLYRFNQIPDATRSAFLDLLQIPLRPATAATGLVTFGTERTDGPEVDLHFGLPVGKLGFQTLDETTVLPITARAAIRAQVDVPTDEESFEFLSRASASLGLSVEDVTTYGTVIASGDPLQPGGDVLDPSTGTIDGMLFMALLAKDAAAVPAARGALAGRQLSMGFVPTQEVPTMAEITACPGGAGALPSPPMEWQISSTATLGSVDGIAEPAWHRLTVTGDTTSGLTTAGVVRLQLPETTDDLGVFAPEDADSTGSGDQPPLTEDEELAPRIVCWLRVFRPDASALTAVEWIGANVARVEHATTAPAELLGIGTGQPDQQYRLVHGSVLGDDLALEVEEQAAVPRFVPWQLVEDFRGSGIDDRHAVIDRQAGVVQFGNGLRGRSPQLGERIRVRSYRYGGGVEGNVAAFALAKVAVTGVTVANPLPTRGGAAAETTAEGVARIPDELRRHDRTVTASDFGELAIATPGADIARAEALALFHPANTDREVPGAITVVVWPGSDRLHPDAPLPDRSQLEAVCRFLDQRRLVTTELYVVPPAYRRISVSVGIAVKPGYGTEAVRRWVEQLIRQYLSPLPPYGPEGGGWPLGHRVHGPELEAAALQVEGVEFLNGLRLSAEVEGAWQELTNPPTLALARYEVPELADVLVVPGDPPLPGTGAAAPSPKGRPVPIRPPREVC
jgi:hypothetical protein